MMHHHLRSMAYLLIGLLALSSGEWNVVHGFTAPIIRGTASATAIGTSPIPPTTKSIDTTTNIIRTAFYFSPRVVLTPSTTTTVTNTAVVLLAEPTDNGDGNNNIMDANEIIARRIIVVGDVDGGYYRSCVKNEASRFRKLIGTMSPPANTKRAEIYVEGKRKMVEGFVRWCERGDVGLSQSIKVDSVIDEFPTGLYDDFYVATGRE